jgi:hypothetical protein
MSGFKAGDRAYHTREGYEGRCTIIEITDKIHATVRWDESDQWNVVNRRELITEEEAERKGLI